MEGEAFYRLIEGSADSFFYPCQRKKTRHSEHSEHSEHSDSLWRFFFANADVKMNDLLALSSSIMSLHALPENVLGMLASERLFKWVCDVVFPADAEHLTIDMVRKHTYMMSEYNERVWDDIIKYHCPEPFLYHINTYKYIKEEMWKKGQCVAVYMTVAGKPEIKRFDKYDWRLLWTNFEYNPDSADMWCIDMNGLRASIADATP